MIFDTAVRLSKSKLVSRTALSKLKLCISETYGHSDHYHDSLRLVATCTGDPERVHVAAVSPVGRFYDMVIVPSHRGGHVHPLRSLQERLQPLVGDSCVYVEDWVTEYACMCYRHDHVDSRESSLTMQRIGHLHAVDKDMHRVLRDAQMYGTLGYKYVVVNEMVREQGLQLTTISTETGSVHVQRFYAC